MNIFSSVNAPVITPQGKKKKREIEMLTTSNLIETSFN